MVVLLDLNILNNVQLLLHSQIFELPLLIALRATNVIWVFTSHQLSKMPFMTKYVVIQLLLEIISVYLISIGIILELLNNLLCSLNYILSNKASFNSLVLKLLYRQALTIKLIQSNLPVKLVWAEYEVPLLEWSSFWSLCCRFHVFCIYFSCMSYNLSIVLFVYRYDFRPFKY